MKFVFTLIQLQTKNFNFVLVIKKQQFELKYLVWFI